MQITATMVKELRERTGAGMMDCKKALQDTAGDIESAIEAMRKSGVAKAAKKAGRIAAEGNIVIKQDPATDRVVILEVNSETDFVAKDENFRAFADSVAACILKQQPGDVPALMGSSLGALSVEEARLQLVAKIGENISVRRFNLLNIKGVLGQYLHGTRIGVVIELQGGNEALARDLAMHIAASRPVCITTDEVPGEMLDKERNIFTAQAAESGKPAEIVEKMVEGKLKKFLNEVTLVGQPFVKDPDQTVGKLLASANTVVRRFIRYEVGEGLEKRSDNFAEEVMAQAGIHKVSDNSIDKE
ncbi:MAG: translation elongation factor Ts [Gammaproteobacteria bacterium RBG_16_51_14]|nr:MAG: translation elongation factor Ts [Gammaproteobacteria bacterium RBG_16_51_14]